MLLCQMVGSALILPLKSMQALIELFHCQCCWAAGADANARTDTGRATPLHRAAFAGHTPVLHMLCVPLLAVFLCANQVCRMHE